MNLKRHPTASSRAMLLGSVTPDVAAVALQYNATLQQVIEREMQQFLVDYDISQDMTISQVAVTICPECGAEGAGGNG